LLFQSLFQVCQEISRSGLVLTKDAVDHYLIAISHISKFPESLIGLRKISQPFKPFQQQRLKVLELGWFDGSPIVVVERNENIILFHPLPPPGLASLLHGSTRKIGCQPGAKP